MARLDQRLPISAGRAARHRVHGARGRGPCGGSLAGDVWRPWRSMNRTGDRSQSVLPGLPRPLARLPEAGGAHGIPIELDGNQGRLQLARCDEADSAPS